MEPIRTCVGCRSRVGRAELVRLVQANDHVVVDARGALPGRGAWIHRSAACLARAISRRAILRALRAGAGLKIDEQQLAARIDPESTSGITNQNG